MPTSKKRGIKPKAKPTTKIVKKPTIFLCQSQPRNCAAGVAEWFRRQPAELLYMGSIPIPSSTGLLETFLALSRSKLTFFEKNNSLIR
jgi:hypothetical protein